MAEEIPQPNFLDGSAAGRAGDTASQRHTASEGQPVEIETPTEVKVLPPKSTYNPGLPPNGGLQAWLQVAGGFMLFFNTWGLLNTFAYFQTYYESGQLFQESSSNISWIGSIQAFLVLLMGTLTGPIYDRGYLRALLGVGSFCIVFGLMMLSISKTYWQVLLAQGFCVGIGAGCLFVPCVSVLPTYWSTKLGLAVGLAVSGSSLGGIIYPIVLYRLVDQIGFPWSVRVVGFIALGTLLVPMSVMKMRIQPSRPRALIDWTAFTDVEYMIFVVASMVAFMGLSTVLFYLPFYVQQRQMTSPGLVFYIVAIFNAGSCLGRVVPTALSDKVGPFNIITGGALITGVLLLCMIPVKREAAAVVMAVLSGIFSGVLIAMPPVCFVPLIKNKSLIGTRIGMGFGMIGLGFLAGGPGAGAILGNQPPYNWTSLWVFAGVTACAGGLMYAGLRVARLGFKLNVKG